MSAARTIQTLLVANRGEIALRVMRTARAMGLRTVAVASEIDRDAPHARFADECVVIGPAPAAESYLSVDAILDAARATGADAIHPGYGFLSENAEFARACEAAGLVFVGPPARAIEVMGNKAEAKRCMLEADVPCVPGYQEEDQSDDALRAAADRIGFPVMVKAAAGGGGKGMRLVRDSKELAAGLERARSEARSAFGSEELILERAIQGPRHVEIQVFADQHGHTVHLGERDCSVQRRHQKVLEEAPCPVLTPELRSAMGEAAVRAAHAVDYVGAGTVEFLLASDGAFYFLEMNTRLQVEHPVTEAVTGLDLVALQLEVAQGRPLPIAQDEVRIDGHAIEARLYAEDPLQDFLPQSGHLLSLVPSTRVRVDAGVESGQQISPFYDPMIAKIIAHGGTRDAARRQLAQALRDTAVFGPTTNRDFLIASLEHPTFADGQATTAFLDAALDEVVEAMARGADVHRRSALAAVLLYRHHRDLHQAAALANPPTLLDWTNASALGTPFRFQPDGGETIALVVRALGADRYQVRFEWDEEGGSEPVQEAPPDLVIEVLTDEPTVDSRTHRARLRLTCVDASTATTVALWAAASDHMHGGTVLHVAWSGGDGGARTERWINQLELSAASRDTAGSGHVTAPMHGVVRHVRAEIGQGVAAGDVLVVLEAMKMQHEITAPIAGAVARVEAADGQQVAAGDLLVLIDED